MQKLSFDSPNLFLLGALTVLSERNVRSEEPKKAHIERFDKNEMFGSMQQSCTSAPLGETVGVQKEKPIHRQQIRQNEQERQRTKSRIFKILMSKLIVCVETSGTVCNNDTNLNSHERLK